MWVDNSGIWTHWKSGTLNQWQVICVCVCMCWSHWVTTWRWTTVACWLCVCVCVCVCVCWSHWVTTWRWTTVACWLCGTPSSHSDVSSLSSKPRPASNWRRSTPSLDASRLPWTRPASTSALSCTLLTLLIRFPFLDLLLYSSVAYVVQFTSVLLMSSRSDAGFSVIALLLNFKQTHSLAWISCEDCSCLSALLRHRFYLFSLL